MSFAQNRKGPNNLDFATRIKSLFVGFGFFDFWKKTLEIGMSRHVSTCLDMSRYLDISISMSRYLDVYQYLHTYLIFMYIQYMYIYMYTYERSCKLFVRKALKSGGHITVVFVPSCTHACMHAPMHPCIHTSMYIYTCLRSSFYGALLASNMLASSVQFAVS